MSVQVIDYLKTNKPKKKKPTKNLWATRTFGASEQTGWFEIKGVGP